MKQWKNSMDEVVFKGASEVLSKIDEDQNSKVTFLHRINDFLSYEIAIPLIPAASVITTLFVVAILNFSPPSTSDTTYQITVINQWGQYENY